MRYAKWLAAASLSVAVVGSAFAAETRRDNYGDWSFVCNKAEVAEGETMESCTLYQVASVIPGGENAAEDAKPQQLLMTRIGYVPENELPLMVLTTPIGVLLKPGLLIEVEGHPNVRIPYDRCDSGGCVASVAMEPEFVDALMKGAEAKVTFMDPQRRPIALPVSLKGVSKGMNELDKSRQ
ncbi:MAG: invasion associated locus B family protein [Gammaproteobacteria bacterium]|nr:invasion associated locus B family protein [Gammaproteobacteria bacterium]